MAGDRDQFNAWCEPETPSAPEGNPKIGAQGMASGTLASELGKDRVFALRSESGRRCRFRGRRRHALFLREYRNAEAGISSSSMDSLIQFPRNQIAIANTVKPGAFPSHESFGVELAGQHGSFWARRAEIRER